MKAADSHSGCVFYSPPPPFYATAQFQPGSVLVVVRTVTSARFAHFHTDRIKAGEQKGEATDARGAVEAGFLAGEDHYR